MLTVDVHIDAPTQELAEIKLPDTKQLRSWAQTGYLGNSKAEVALSLLNSNEVRHLNKTYREKNKATNVLSFPSDHLVIDDSLHLGDIILCAEVIDREANEQKKSESAHWAHMVIHGMLHLQGYDHITDDDANKMEALEINLLAQLGFPDPYQTTDYLSHSAQEAAQQQ